MKRLLIISPYFAPVNTPDMQRVRMSLPFFEQYGWDAEVVMVNPEYTDRQTDELLLETIPASIKIHTVKALSKQWTNKAGIGNIAYRSYPFYRKKVNKLLKEKKFDLIYFSTTQFPICVLGAYWKQRFGVPYVIDMQDPWYSNYYDDKPKNQQPVKFELAYGLHKLLEPIAMKQVGGLISVSANYINNLKSRYPSIKHIPESVITFGGFKADMDIALKNKDKFTNLLNPAFKNIVYVGRGGADMHSAIIPVFEALRQGLTDSPELYHQLKFHFIGTSYAPNNEGIQTIMPLAKQFGVENNVIEITNRISYFHTLNTLMQADALFIPGSDDPNYTASKIYPYLLAQKPLLAIFNSKSPALNVLNECGVKQVHCYDDKALDLSGFFNSLITNNIVVPDYNMDCMEKYSAQAMTRQQCDLFNKVININKQCV